MLNETTGENQSNNEEQEVEEETQEETQEEEVDVEALKKENETLKKENQTLEVQKGKWKEKAEAKPEEPDKAKAETQSNEPDYARLAFLEQRKVTHPDDQKLVQEEAERLKMPLTDVLSMEHIKSKLKDAHDQREAQDGMPKGSGRAKGVTKNDVAYHLAKGTTPEDPELAEKVIEARMKKETQGNKFSEELFTG